MKEIIGFLSRTSSFNGEREVGNLPQFGLEYPYVRTFGAFERLRAIFVAPVFAIGFPVADKESRDAGAIRSALKNGKKYLLPEFLRNLNGDAEGKVQDLVKKRFSIKRFSAN